MTLSPEQIKALKQQLLSQIQHLPEEQKAEAIKQIDSLSPQALELMLKQQQTEGIEQQSIFRSIVNKEVPSTIISENDWAIAVLEINPVSKGHTIIIPKTAIKNKEDLPESIKKLAKNIENRLKEKLNPKAIETTTELKFGEIIIDLIPVYDNKPLNKNKRYKAKKQELEELENLLKIVEEIKPKIEKIKIETKKEKQPAQVLKLKRKIP